MVTYFFFKNIAFGLTIFIFNMHTKASGQTVYNDWLMSSFNIFFTNFPVLALGILDQDVKPQSSMEVPELYTQQSLFAVRLFLSPSSGLHTPYSMNSLFSELFFMLSSLSFFAVLSDTP